MNNSNFQKNSPRFHCAFLLLHSYAHVQKVWGLWKLLQHGITRGIVNNDFIVVLVKIVFKPVAVLTRECPSQLIFC